MISGELLTVKETSPPLPSPYFAKTKVIVVGSQLKIHAPFEVSLSKDPESERGKKVGFSGLKLKQQIEEVNSRAGDSSVITAENIVNLF